MPMRTVTPSGRLEGKLISHFKKMADVLLSPGHHYFLAVSVVCMYMCVDRELPDGSRLEVGVVRLLDP